MSFRLSSLACFLLAASVALPARAAELVRGERHQWTHSTAGTHVVLSGAAVAVRSDGTPLLAWIAPEGDVNHLWVVAPGESGAAPVRVDPPGLAVDSLHQAPGLACGAGGEVVVSWSSVKPKPEGTLFASDLRLSRSGDGGRTFGAPLRANEDRPISHSFDGLAVAAGGSVLLAWIDSREGWQKAGTYVARVSAGGTKVDRVEQVGSETCVCCRVAVATGGERAAVLWRKDYPDQVRDMVLAVSDGAGASFAVPVRVNEDRWRMPACPHRGGGVAIDGAGRIHAAWYTEGTSGRPALLFATSPDGERFGDPLRIDASEGSIPDHVRLAVATGGGILVAWEDSTAVRRRILARLSVDGGKTFGPVEQLSSASVKAYSPALAPAPSGGFALAWTEEEFPVTRSVVQMLRVAGT